MTQPQTLFRQNNCETVLSLVSGTDVVRGGTGAWDGYVDITLKVTGGTAPSGGKYEDKTDNVKLRLAPMLFRHHLEPAETIYATFFSDADSTAFRGIYARRHYGVGTGQRTCHV